MKKLLFILVAALAVFSGCNSDQFKVTLNLDNADQRNVYLCKLVDGNTVTIDSAVIAGKNAVMTAPKDDPQRAYLLKFDSNECGIFPFFTENQNITITGNIDSLANSTVTGYAIMDEWAAYRASLLPMEEEMMAIYNESTEAYLAGDTARAAELFAEVEAKMEAYEDMRLDYYRNHAESFLTHFMLDQEKEQLEYEDVKSVADAITTESMYSRSINEYLERIGRAQVGQPIIDFTLQTAEGAEVNLATVVAANTLTLVDFWASWCGPCRRENPVVKAAYEKYHAKGLEIIGVSVDRDAEAWMAAVQEDGLPWTQVRDVDHAVSNDYSVMYIPSNFLFDQNGVMVAKGLRGEELEAKLAEILE